MTNLTTKIIETSVSVIGIAASLLSGWFADKKNERRIEEAVKKVLSEKEIAEVKAEEG